LKKLNVLKIKLLMLIFLALPTLIFSQGKDSIAPQILNDHNKQFKLNLFPALGGRVDISYEHLTKQRGSYDIGLNMIGMISGSRFAPKGVIAHAGYKFFFQYALTNEEVVHPFSGLYFEPVLMGGYTETIYQYEEPLPEPQKGFNLRERTVSTKYVAAFMNIGRQFILYNRLSIDLSAGLGVGSYSGRLDRVNEDLETPASHPENFGFMVLGPNNILRLTMNVPLAVNAGIRLGYVFR
jgi:hypothetical protein